MDARRVCSGGTTAVGAAAGSKRAAPPLYARIFLNSFSSKGAYSNKSPTMP